MSDLVIRQLTPSITIFSRPFTRGMVVPFGGRSTAIKLASGKVWLLASTPLDQETKQKVDSIGPVEWLVSPDIEHTGFIKDYAQTYPMAKVIGVEGMDEKLKDVKVHGMYTRANPSATFGFEPEIQACYFPGFVNKDVAFLHTADAGTLIEADLLFNTPGHGEQYSKAAPGLVQKLAAGAMTALHPHSKLHQFFLNMTSQQKDEMKRDATTVSKWTFDRIIPCHGDVIETNGKAAWLAAYEQLLSPQ